MLMLMMVHVNSKYLCTDPSAFNYNPNANIMVCVLINIWMYKLIAFNYNEIKYK